MRKQISVPKFEDHDFQICMWVNPICHLKSLQTAERRHDLTAASLTVEYRWCIYEIAYAAFNLNANSESVLVPEDRRTSIVVHCLFSSADSSTGRLNIRCVPIAAVWGNPSVDVIVKWPTEKSVLYSLDNPAETSSVGATFIESGCNHAEEFNILHEKFPDKSISENIPRCDSTAHRRTFHFPLNDGDAIVRPLFHKFHLLSAIEMRKRLTARRHDSRHDSLLLKERWRGGRYPAERCREAMKMEFKFGNCSLGLRYVPSW